MDIRKVAARLGSFCGIAAPGRTAGGEEEPLRAELLSVDQLKRFAQELAEKHEIETRPGRNRLLSRLEDNARALRAAHAVILEADAAGRRLSPAEEWLLDNFYLIEQQIELARIHLPRRYSRLLPRLTRGQHLGLPRVYGMAAELIAHRDGLLDAESTSAFAGAYQSAKVLSMGELWALPIALRLALIENLRRVAVRMAGRRGDLTDGVVWAERLMSVADTAPRQLIHSLARFAEAHPVLSAPFLSELVGRLQSRGASLAIVLNWIDQTLAEESTTVAQLLQQDGHRQAAEQISVTNSIGSLRFLGGMDWKAFVEEQSRVEQILRRDPAGAYVGQDFATRDHYRHIVEQLALRSKRSETAVARMALELATAASQTPDGGRSRHVGSWLVGGDRFQFRRRVGCPLTLRYALGLLLRRYRLFFYLTAVFGGTLLIAAWPPWFCGVPFDGWRIWVLVAAALVPASTLALSLVNFVVTARVAPHPLPRLDFSGGIPDAHRTMVVVPSLLRGAHTLDTLLERLEIHFLGNRDRNLQFALLTDFPDADTATLPTDSALLQRAQDGIARLNARHQRVGAPPPFHLFHRPRVWNPHERVWMGYERKRGKLAQLNDLLRGVGEEAFGLIAGDREVLPTVRYVITLDDDTDLPRGAARALAGAMAHPLNRPRFDPVRGQVVEGYAILQPRVSVRLVAANRSLYARMACGETGLDPYSREISDVYQDLFSEGSFVGKGIYDVDAFRQALAGRFPDNLILSHDLIESSYARSGLLGCVELYEDTPVSYLGEVSRQHRWIRGDWQIIRWLGWRPPASGSRRARGRPVSRLSQWKILDNLRRALSAPAMLVLLLAGWTCGPVHPACWTLFVLAVMGLTGVVRSVTLLLRKPRERGLQLHLRAWMATLLRHCALPLFSVSMLPYEAWIALCAFARSALRLPFTRRGLLRWHLPQYRRRNARRTPGGFLAEMWSAPAAALLTLTLVLTARPAALPAALPLALLWLLAPLTAWAASRPLRRRAPALAREHWRMLHRLACRTWHFFDVFMSAEDHWLPPDNFQETPRPMVASRTSPTNLAFGLCAALTAWDFGYLSTETMIVRLTRMLDTMERLERFRGHFFNWYDTRRLTPLPPRYVSSVDSGNLAAGLLLLRAGLQELIESPASAPQVWDGLRDTLGVLKEEARAEGGVELMTRLRETQLLLDAPPIAPCDRLERLRELLTASARLAQAAESGGTPTVREWCGRLNRQCQDHAAFAERLGMGAAHDVSLRQLARGSPETGAAEAAAALVRDLDHLAERCRELAAGMDFRFLYNKQRELLHIGFDADSRRLDPSCYDLLASEARVASFLMIADGQAPPDHWFALGRLLSGRGGSAALASWSGSIFEYLMPALIMPAYPNTLLERTCNAVIQRQMRYARQRHVPWGISESCYNATDAQHVYQYRAFGVPGLGLKRGLADDLVVAPYATLLALPFAPAAACDNLERLMAHEEALGDYGLFEALDFTPSRVPRGKERAVVRCYMAHHQGMGLLALSHCLLDAPMVRRFMSDPAVRATEVLLQERVPVVSPVVQPHRDEFAPAGAAAVAETCGAMRHFTDPGLPVPETHLLSNGNYHVMVTHAGGGYSRWRDLALTRWREDVTRDNWGLFLYVRDVASGQFWSGAYQPVCRRADREEALFTQGRAEFCREFLDIEAQTEICVSPEDDVEIRRVTLNNHGRHARRLELTSYAEVVLAPPAADLAHRVFSSLFVRTEILPGAETVLCTRRRRDDREPEVWYFHQLCVPGQSGHASAETDRARFLGRNRTPARPAALDVPAGTEAALSGTDGFVLDPVAAVRQPVAVTTEAPLQAFLVCGAAYSREAAVALAEKYRDRHLVERAFDMAWSHSQIVMRLIGATEAETQVYGRLAGSVLYANPRNRAPWTVVASNRLGQQGLWRFGISGDLPVVLLRIGDIHRMDLVADVLRAHAYWRLKGLQSDLVILNEDFSGYRATLNDRILAAIGASPDAELLDKPGGIFLRRVENLSEEDRVLFQSVARVVLTDSAENLREQTERRFSPRPPPPRLEPVTEEPGAPPAPLPPRPLILDNGVGGFAPDGREYIMLLEPGQTTPAPWANVIAGKRIGMVVSESGGIYTWVDNAHEYRLTPWYNDPVSDPSGEAFYLRDDETGRYWSLAPRPSPGRTGTVCRHGFGYTVFEHAEEELDSEMWLYAAIDAPVRCAVVRLTNTSERRRRVSLTAFHELVLGEWRHDNQMHIHTEADSQGNMLLARNPYNRVFPRRVVFAACSGEEIVLGGDRTEFLGRNGSPEAPAALARERLSGRTGARYDPAAVLQTFCELAPGESREVVFTLGAAEDPEEARNLFRKHGGPAGARATLEAVREHWSRILGAVQVEMPGEPAINALVNGWLLYQALSCRIWGRSGYYQSGGAFGFRDQLQDAMALLHADPSLLRGQIMLCAGRQFREGDVQHWWHPPTGAGVRTRISDDRLWLPQAVARYVLATGDTAVLDEPAPFLEGRPLAEGEESRYDQHLQTTAPEPLYEHCLRAIRASLACGAGGLPLIGAGDWNDGLNRVGAGGRGESVWLAWFICDTLRRFADVARLRGDDASAAWCREEREALAARAESAAWDGEWYRRATFDDGTPLGTAADAECRIDAISQSWAVLGGAAGPARARRAMESVRQHLIRPDDGLILLLDPPFDKTPRDPGYIRSYPPGVRENGGQYTHAAIWTAMAFAEMGDHDAAWELLRMLVPANHSDSPATAARYRTEPYVMTADVYSVAPHTGRGGWSWYTGAAAWMYRLTVETLLGLERHPDHLIIAPRLPSRGPGSFKITYRHGGATYRIAVRPAPTGAAPAVVVDGAPRPDGRIPLQDDGREHSVTVTWSRGGA